MTKPRSISILRGNNKRENYLKSAQYNDSSLSFAKSEYLLLTLLSVSSIAALCFMLRRILALLYK